MKMFDKPAQHINFIDKNNVCVGYDMDHQCCEDAGYFFSDKPRGAGGEDETELAFDTDLDSYIFDTKYEDEGMSDESNEKFVAVFRLTGDGPDRFLHLYNCHNGYYGHGFTVDRGDTRLSEGYL